MYYKEPQIIIRESFIIDIETGQKFEFEVKRKIMNCYPEKISQEDIDIAEKEGIEIPSSLNFSDEELRARRWMMAKYLKSIKRVKKIIYSFV